MGGGGGTAIGTAAMRALPVGVPKLMLSTLASGDVRAYVGVSDVTMMPSVVDIAGINRLSARIIANAAGAIAGMVKAEAPPVVAGGPTARRGHHVRRHHALRHQGARRCSRRRATRCSSSTPPAPAGRCMEALIRAGFIAGVLDITTTELADELAGGVLSAGPHRLEAAGETGIPQVVSVGALDMVNFGPPDTVPGEVPAGAPSTGTTRK